MAGHDSGIGYESVGFARIRIAHDAEGVTVLANADGFRSLARLFADFAERTEHAHIHLMPGMQLSGESEALTVAIKDLDS